MLKWSDTEAYLSRGGSGRCWHFTRFFWLDHGLIRLTSEKVLLLLFMFVFLLLFFFFALLQTQESFFIFVRPRLKPTELSRQLIDPENCSLMIYTQKDKCHRTLHLHLSISVFILLLLLLFFAALLLGFLRSCIFSLSILYGAFLNLDGTVGPDRQLLAVCKRPGQRRWTRAHSQLIMRLLICPHCIWDEDLRNALNPPAFSDRSVCYKSWTRHVSIVILKHVL